MHGSKDETFLVHCNIRTILHHEEGGNRKDYTMFGYVSKIANRMRAPSTEEREMAYLNASTDRVDLEYRQRQIDRGMFRNRSMGFL